MNKSTRKTISKETQDAIKRFLTSNISSRMKSPSTPTIGLDANFSQILQKKREEQLEASRRLFDSTTSKCESMLDANDTQKKCDSLESAPIKRNAVAELENSMMFSKMNKSWNDLSDGEDSFLALERQCNMDDKKERLINANDTLLFDVEPPSELWNQTVNQSLAIATLDHSQDEDGDETIEISPVKYVGMTRPSTIIEETSSQFDSSSKNSSASATKSSLYATASINESAKDATPENGDLTSNSQTSKNASKVSPLSEQNSQNSQITKAERQRRGTFAFKRANYTFFPNENLEPINESASFSEHFIKSPAILSVETPKMANPKSKSPVLSKDQTPNRDLLDFETKSKDPEIENDEDQFNNTLERVDYLLEKGRQMLEETPVAKRSSHHSSIMETPLFSCKRKRLLSEMASIEMLPLPKRGPLIDFSTPEVTKARINKFTGK